MQGPTENRQGEWAPWLNIIIIIIIIVIIYRVLVVAQTLVRTEQLVSPDLQTNDTAVCVLLDSQVTTVNKVSDNDFLKYLFLFLG